jgi:hypothetical protein
MVASNASNRLSLGRMTDNAGGNFRFRLGAHSRRPPVHRASAEVEGGLARVSERVPRLGVHNSNKTSTTAVAKMPAMVQIDGFCFWPYIATSF